MINRRNIRIKVMQTLYALEAANPSVGKNSLSEDMPSIGDNTLRGRKILNEKIEHSSNLFTLMVLYLSRIAQYVEIDARNRGAKYLKTKEDTQVNTKLAGNKTLWEILENHSFKLKIKNEKLEEKIDGDWVKNLFRSLAETTEYQEYLALEERPEKAEKKIMQFIWKKIMLQNEKFNDFISDEWNNWDDDYEMNIILFENLFKNIPQLNFQEFISVEKKEYALTLLETVLSKNEYLMELLHPKLKNWDADRVALIDLVLIKMGISELIYFPTIPIKVSINEYIEIAKNYSTQQSGQFVNGVLDSILKDLTKENKVQKINRNK